MKFVSCKERPKVKKDRKVAIIGAGPAGLKAAGYLICKGYEVFVYDKMPKPGGLLLFGIPEWRFPKAPIKKAINELREYGVNFIMNVEVGKDIDILEIVRNFDAVLIATGTWKEKKLGIEGENLEGVYSVLDLLVSLALHREGYLRAEDLPKLGKRAVVIGGGSSAIDVARTLVRLGIKTTVLYRRMREHMPAHGHEVKDAEKEGVNFIFLVSPKRILADSSSKKVGAIELIKNKLSEPDSSGRPRPVPIEGSEFIIETDAVIVAIGEIPTPPKCIEKLNIKLDSRGRIITDDKGMTSYRGVFAAGDVVLGPSTIGKALVSGLKVAKNIDEFLS